MIGALKSLSDRLLGRGDAAVTVPPLDGPLKPDNRLEEAPPGIATPEPAALAAHQGRVIWASGHQLLGPDGPIADVGAEITALATSGAGQLAHAATGRGITLDGAVPEALAGLDCVTALAFDGEGVLWIAIGSTVNPFAQWSRDFLERRRTGRVLRYDIAGGTLHSAAEGLAFPFGILPTAAGPVISESWASRLIRLEGNGRVVPVIDDLPGYPAGLTPTAGGGAWLAVFAPRSPLIELVLREPAYRRAMMAEVDPEFWIAPALRSGYSFREPMQGGALKQMGILKPWAPTRSYGLVVELGADFTPIRSLHSRAGGQRHGITAVVTHKGTLWAASRGGNEVLQLDLGAEGN